MGPSGGRPAGRRSTMEPQGEPSEPAADRASRDLPPDVLTARSAHCPPITVPGQLDLESAGAFDVLETTLLGAFAPVDRPS